MRKINVISLFDGCSMAKVALNELGIEVENYFASEIDKYAMQISKKNHPDIIQLGDVKNVHGGVIPIDLVIGGFPCQSFSIAGKRLNFDDERGQLFFEALRVLREVKPKYFLLENVASMKKEIRDMISKEIGVEPILINSSLVSAQQRKRLFWTNIPNIEQPGEQNIVIADILNLRIVNKRKNKIIMSKENFKVKVRKNYINCKELCCFLRNYKNKSINQIAEECDVSITKAEHWFRRDNSFSIPDEFVWGKLKQCLKITSDKYDKQITEFEIKNNNYDMAKRIYHIDGKHPTLTTLTGGGQRKTITDGKEKFYLTPEHCEKLQTLEPGYTSGVSNTQRYKMIGKGFTVKVISHILKNMKKEEK